MKSIPTTRRPASARPSAAADKANQRDQRFTQSAGTLRRVNLGLGHYRDILVDERYKSSGFLSKAELARRASKKLLPITALKPGTRVLVDINTTAKKDPIWAPGTVRKAAYLQLSTMKEFENVPTHVTDDDIGASVSVHFDTGDWAHVMSLAKIKLLKAPPQRRGWANPRVGRKKPRPVW